jgi:hypothetical protein
VEALFGRPDYININGLKITTKKEEASSVTIDNASLPSLPIDQNTEVTFIPAWHI